MDALDAIRTRRMITRVEERPPSKDEIERLLELAVRAPNHHRTEPWRFYVLAGDARGLLAAAIADESIASGQDEARAADEALKKVERAPVIVVFTAVVSDDPKVVEQEEIVAVGMAMENFLLGAYASGLGAMLRTGGAAYDPAIKQHLGLAENEHVVGFVYLGYPAAEREMTERAPASGRTTWLDN